MALLTSLATSAMAAESSVMFVLVAAAPPGEPVDKAAATSPSAVAAVPVKCTAPSEASSPASPRMLEDQALNAAAFLLHHSEDCSSPLSPSHVSLATAA
eukprot:CAMPEP_0115700438 /NCGR_PEP_ID=MMETSP0272-20121206/67418_1 /TAXON_ID=71861 /ORGANISM="Scrippsiella trochoidea, Strain CCMP3099" /LENGTH=98 /DNA_ID=CAMNT_0003140941 /DNA_START=344 /DNA_END=640 /DNA_ORIENTATION=-